MKDNIVSILMRLHLYARVRKVVIMFSGREGCLMKFPPYDAAMHDLVISTTNPVRCQTIALAINSIKKDNIDGCFAEVGVHRGGTSRLLHALAPERDLYLFDTFEGFPSQDLDTDKDERFRDTGVEIVKQKIGSLSNANLDNVIVRKGYFPETAKGLEDKVFSFVMLDLDLYKPTLAGLEFFYPRVNSGGYIMAHDYNNPESNWGVSRAVDEFMRDKPERIIEIPDKWGSVVIGKI